MIDRERYAKRLKAALERQDWQCTGWPDGNWQDCCRAHDRGCAKAEAMRSSAYRLVVDRRLRECVRAKGHPIMARLMYAGVRAFAIARGGY